MAEKIKILLYCCENSAIKSIDALDNTQILKDVDVVKLPCSGKVEVGLILKCFENGYGAVAVLGCPLDNCKFIKGNYRAKKRVDNVKRALREAGINEERVAIDFVSSVDSHKVVRVLEEMKSAVLKQCVTLKDTA